MSKRQAAPALPDPGEAQKFFERASIPTAIQEKLQVYADLLLKWQKTINLISPGTIPDLWQRHFADSWQVFELAPEARLWLDIGSGAGFPGLVTAIRYADDPTAAEVHLIESDQRKCAFLQTVVRETYCPAVIHCGRIEDVLPKLDLKFEAVSARALAPLPKLIDYTKPCLEGGAIGIFPKGETAEAEIYEVSRTGNFSVEVFPSCTSSRARVIRIRRRSKEFVNYEGLGCL